MNKRGRQQAPGFTLIELLVVVAIIGILAAIAVPQFLFFSWRAKRSEAVINLNAIYIAEISYFSSFDQYALEQSINDEGNVLNRLGLPGLEQDLKHYGKICGVLPSCLNIQGSGPGFRIDMHAKLDRDLSPPDWMFISSESQITFSGPFAPARPHLFFDDILNMFL